MKVLHVRCGEVPEVVEMPDQPTLRDWQQMVGGLIEPFDVMDGVCCYVNEEGIGTCPPNRAVYADKRMEEVGYLDMLSYSHPVKEGELYTVLFGDFVIYGGIDYDDEGNELYRGLGQDQIERYTARFATIDSGFFATLALKGGLAACV